MYFQLGNLRSGWVLQYDKLYSLELANLPAKKSSKPAKVIHHLLSPQKKSNWTILNHLQINHSTMFEKIKAPNETTSNNFHKTVDQLPTFRPRKQTSWSNTEPLQSVPTVSTAFSKSCLRPSWQNLKNARNFSKIGFAFVFFGVEVVEIWMEFWDSIYITYHFFS